MNFKAVVATFVGILMTVGIIIAAMFETIPAGQVGVATLFGKVQDTVYTEGINLVNPLAKITLFDARQKTHKETMGVPSKDQLITEFALSIQYRLIKELAPSMLKETGTTREVIDVHMMPLLRSQMREVGKSVERSEDFFDQEVQQRIQTDLFTGLSPLAAKGVKIEKLLIREVVLPKIITNAVMRKKEAAQAAEKAKEELKKFKVDQERKEAQAQAEKRAEIIQAQKKAEVALTIANGNLEAARVDAQAVLVKAKAEAEAKQKMINVLGRDGYIRLETAGVLPKLANGNHVIVMDPKGNMLPFMNMDKFK